MGRPADEAYQRNFSHADQGSFKQSGAFCKHCGKEVSAITMKMRRAGVCIALKEAATVPTNGWQQRDWQAA